MSKRIHDYQPESPWCDMFADIINSVIHFVPPNRWSWLLNLSHQPTFREEYQHYINSYDQAAEFATQARHAFEARGKSVSSPMEMIGEFIEKQLAEVRQFTHLSSYLITPVQRLPRYILFFRDLLKCTPPKHVDHPHILEALSTLSKSAFSYWSVSTCWLW